MISIASLIYRSPSYADSVWDSLHRHTPHLLDGRAQFFFVANDPMDYLLEHLNRQGYPYILHCNRRHDMKWLWRHGLAAPEYLRRVYTAWNRAIAESDEWCVLVNSDMRFSPGWLDALWEHRGEKKYVVSQLFEPKRDGMPIAPKVIPCELGHDPHTFSEHKWLARCRAHAERQGAQWTRLRPGGMYQPCLIHRETALAIGGFPRGNLLRPEGRLCRAQSGDEWFVHRLKERLGRHFTVCDSRVYHFHEGEDRER